MNIGIKALVLRILSEDSESGGTFFLGKMETPNGLQFCRVSGRGRWVRAGFFISAEGQWKTTESAGNKATTFRAKYIRPEIPTRRDSVELFFSTIFTPQRHRISEQALREMISANPSGAVEAVFAMPEKLVNCSDEPIKYAGPILEDLSFYRSVIQSYLAMRYSGIRLESVDTIMHHIDPGKQLGLIFGDPWHISKLPGVTLDDADKLGNYLGYFHGDTRRTNAALITILEEYARSGSTLALKSKAYSQLLDTGIPLAGVNKYFDEAHHSADITVVETEKDGARDTGGTEPGNEASGPFVALTRFYQAECSIAEFLRRRRWNSNVSKGANRLIAGKVLSSLDFKHLDDQQKRAVTMAAEEPVSVITGGPGTGKSTILRALVRVYDAAEPNRVLLAAPTGKAAKRLSETTGRSAVTVHKLLRARLALGSAEGTVFAVNEFNPLPPRSVVVVDEASMLDSETAAALVKAIPENGRLILAGDKNQLMSVGAGNVLDDILGDGGLAIVPSIELVNVYRQSRDSYIAIGARDIQEGKIPAMGDSGDVVFMPTSDESIADAVEDLVTRILAEGKYGAHDIAVLAPMMAGHGGVVQLNQRLSGVINPNGEPIQNFYAKLNDSSERIQMRVGDRIMFTDNDFESDIVNGDTGYIAGFARGALNRPVVEVVFDHGKKVEYPINKWKSIIPAYCTTVHKSQGSQYPVVVMPVSTNHSRMLERRLLYTGWTRAQSQLFIVGSKAALLAGLKNIGQPRMTALRKLFLSNAPAVRLIERAGHEQQKSEEIESRLAALQTRLYAGKRSPEPSPPGAASINRPLSGLLIKPPPVAALKEMAARPLHTLSSAPRGLFTKKLSEKRTGLRTEKSQSADIAMERISWEDGANDEMSLDNMPSLSGP
jgi:exodeoxyribonuclease V alpha subunit